MTTEPRNSAEVRSEAELDVLEDIVGVLAKRVGSEDGLDRAAALLCQRGLVHDVRIWRRTRTGDQFLPVVGGANPAVPAIDVGTWLGETAPTRDPQVTSLRVPVPTESETLGLVEATVPAPRAEHARHVLSVFANVLGLWMASAELSEDLASEVANRTREIDAHRRFTSQIIDSLPVGLYVIDRRYRIQAWNRKREGIGIAREDALGRDVFDVLTRQPRELLKREYDTVFATGRIEQIDVDTQVDGQMRQFRISKIPMRMDGDEVTHVITIGEDVTEWKTVHEQIFQTEKLAAIGQLAAGVMHELNNPLATIGACVEALTVRMPDLPPADQQALDEYLRIIDSELERCKAIIDGLLDFSHPKAHAKQAEQINQVVEDALFLIKHHSKFRRINLVRDLAEGLPVIYGNAKQLMQIFLAIMLNAIDAMEGAGTLTVETLRNTERPDEVVVAISDTGFGIPREALSKIFEPFFTTKVTGRGTGLGLSICYAVVQEHRGRIVADSTPGSGSTFRVYLPTMASIGAGE